VSKFITPKKAERLRKETQRQRYEWWREKFLFAILLFGIAGIMAGFVIYRNVRGSQQEAYRHQHPHEHGHVHSGYSQTNLFR
jgi:ABC-type nickel/cobalt efflux system permease component RcnA